MGTFSSKNLARIEQAVQALLDLDKQLLYKPPPVGLGRTVGKRFCVIQPKKLMLFQTPQIVPLQ